MRNIAKNAGLTTGALYTKFDGKDAIFSELVSPITTKFEAMLKHAGEPNANNPHQSDMMWLTSMPKEIVVFITSFIFNNKDLFILLINCSTGSRCENYVDTLISKQESRIYAKVTQKLQEKNSINHFNQEDIHNIISAEFYATFEVIRHDMTYEQACDQIYNVFHFFNHGWQGIFKEN